MSAFPRPALNLTGVEGATFYLRDSPNWDFSDREARRHAQMIDTQILRDFLPGEKLTELSETMLRSGQLATPEIKKLPDIGVKRIITLRGDPTGSVVLQTRACAELGIEQVVLPCTSRHAPHPSYLKAWFDLFPQLEKLPGRTLIHCKAGADRTGLIAALYRHLVQGWTIEQAKRELSWRYGHVRWGSAGILDRFLELYQQRLERGTISLPDWVASEYDQEALNRAYRDVHPLRRLLGTGAERLLGNE